MSQALVIAGATLLALSLREPFRGRGLVRLLVLLPWVAPISLGAIGWKWLLDSLYSVVTWMLVALSLVNASDPPMWLGEPRLAMLSVILRARVAHAAVRDGHPARGPRRRSRATSPRRRPSTEAASGART